MYRPPKGVPVLLVTAVALAVLVAASAAADADPYAILQMLDYLGVDYPRAVQDGRILDQAEYDEQIEFATTVRSLIGGLPPRGERAALEVAADGLLGAIQGKRPAEEVAALAGDLRQRIIDRYEVRVTPPQAPDPRAGAAAYATHCTSCHGATGRGDGPAAKGLTPPPADLTDAARMGRLSVFSLYNTITLGIKGTAMTGFASLDEPQRWALAFHVSTLSGPRAAREAPLDRCARLLDESLEAYRRGEVARAHQLAITSYLEGFELVEGPLDAVDRGLRKQVEAQMLRYRTLVQSRAPREAVEAEAAAIRALLATARQRLDAARLSPVATFTSALVILLREGLEAILVLAALITMLLRAGRREALRYVHVGWVAALVLGALTWVAASYVVTVSGASREVTEGATALLAAAMLLYVGFWMHRHAHAARWKALIEARVASVLSGRTLWAIAAIAFLAVYREAFETVLFYQALAIEAGPAGHLAVGGGLAAAATALAVLAWLILKVGLRLPVGWFFGLGSCLMAILAVSLAGKGITALQRAGAVPIGAVDLAVVTQVALVVLIVAALTYSRRRERARAYLGCGTMRR